MGRSRTWNTIVRGDADRSVTPLGSTGGASTRQTCGATTCFATFEVGGVDGDVRHCNRAGPDGGHIHRRDANGWQLVTGHMPHDRV
jgi:hypothetical protein